MLRSESILKIASALLKAQKEMGNAVKDSKNPFFKSTYADLNSVREAVTPALHANSISILQTMIPDTDGRSHLETILMHESGEYLGSQTPIVCAKQNDPQALGSAISYARRYGLSSLLSIGAEDNDAEGAMNRAKTASTSTTASELVSGNVETKKANPFKRV